MKKIFPCPAEAPFNLKEMPPNKITASDLRQNLLPSPNPETQPNSENGVSTDSQKILRPCSANSLGSIVEFRSGSRDSGNGNLVFSSKEKPGLCYGETNNNIEMNSLWKPKKVKFKRD